MRLPRDRSASWMLLIPFLAAADLLAIWVWAARPRSVYLDWLGLGELADDAPIKRLDDWLHWKSGPRTPSGCISLFGLGELCVAGLLLFTLVFLIAIPLVARWSGGASGRRSSAPVNAQTAAALRFRVRTTLVAIAILGLYLSWEVRAWRTWRLRIFYLSRAAQEASGERSELNRLESIRSILADVKAGTLRLDDYPPGKRGGFQSKGSLIAEGFTNQVRLDREIIYLTAKIAAITARLRKYERAAADPNTAIDPDPPFPAREPESNEGSARDPARAPSPPLTSSPVPFLISSSRIRRQLGLEQHTTTPVTVMGSSRLRPPPARVS